MELLQISFQKFAVHGDTKATGKELNGKNWAKLCKDCGIIDGKNVTSTDVDIVFSKVKWVSSVFVLNNLFEGRVVLPLLFTGVPNSNGRPDNLQKAGVMSINDTEDALVGLHASWTVLTRWWDSTDVIFLYFISPIPVCFRQKTARVLTFEDFQRALEHLAPKRFKGQSEENALRSIYSLVEGKGPTNIGVTVRALYLLRVGPTN